MTASDGSSPPYLPEGAYAFVAFASSPTWLYDTVNAAISNANASQALFTFHGWPANDIPGRPLAGPVQIGITNASFLVADISTLNLNVIYEIGFAIARGNGHS